MEEREARKKEKKKGRKKKAKAKSPSKREQLVTELLSSERAHVENLHSLVNDFVIPLRDKKILSTEELHDICSNVELLRSWNVQFLEQLEGLLEDGCGFGELFLEMIPMLRQLYAQYSENYAQAMETYERSKKNKEFAAFLEKVQKEKGEEKPVNQPKTFLSFLYLPIQRMIAYDSLLKDLTTETPLNHPDHGNLSKALKALREAADHADKLANQRKNIDKVLSIQSQLIGETGEYTSLAQPHRRFVYEGDVMSIVGKTQRERRLFLFNDILLCVQPKKNKGLNVDFLEPLETLRVEDMYQEDVKDSRYCFRLHSAAKQYTLLSMDKAYWLQLLSDSIRKRQAKNDTTDTYHDRGEEEEVCSKEKLITLILMWSKMEDKELVANVREFATGLERWHS